MYFFAFHAIVLFLIGEHDRVFRCAFEFLDQPANRGDPLSAGDQTGGINIEMN